MKISEEQYNALNSMYKSEGYGILVNLIDESINTELGKLLGGEYTDTQLSGIIHTMRGFGKARSLVESKLKEEEVNYGK